MFCQCIIIVAILMIGISCVVDTEIWGFGLADDALNTNYYEGGLEYHCFDTTNTTKTFVRGTYGMFGYFEGEVSPNDPHTFNVNWWETVTNSITQTRAGSASIKYTLDWTNVTGPYWTSASYGSSSSTWHSINGQYLGSTSEPYIVYLNETLTGPQTALTYCLYPGQAVLAQPAYEPYEVISTSSKLGTNSICQIPFGGPSGWLGTYMYNFADDDDVTTQGIETGNYCINSFGFELKSGFGFIGDWNAMTGPFAGMSGPSVYILANMDFDAGSTSYRHVMFGYYCNTGADNIRTSCFPESYNIIPNTTIVTGIISNPCPNGFVNSGLLDPVFEFSYEGTNHVSTCDIPFPIATVVLGITTFICMCSTLYLLWKKMYLKYLEDQEDTSIVGK